MEIEGLCWKDDQTKNQTKWFDFSRYSKGNDSVAQEGEDIDFYNGMTIKV